MPRHRLPFLGDPPDREQWVLGQGVEFDPEHWRAHLGDDTYLPSEFATLPRSKGYRVIDRGTVHGIAHRATGPLGALHTYVAAAVWGSGKRPARPRKIFTGEAERSWEIAEVFDAVATVLAVNGPGAAYRAMKRGGSLNIPSLGPAYATKFFYYIGYCRPLVAGRHPLILDKNVAVALNRLLDLGWPTSGWTSGQYETYLDIAGEWSDEWDGCGPDVIERVLFSIGQSGSLAVAALTGLPPR